MFNIQLMNKIAKVGTDVFDKNQFLVGEDVAEPTAMMVRSASLHDTPLPPPRLLRLQERVRVLITFLWMPAPRPAFWYSTPPVPMPTA